MPTQVTADQIYDDCKDTDAGDQEEQLKCIIGKLVEQDGEDENYTSRIFLVYSAALVFFMQVGLQFMLYLDTVNQRGGLIFYFKE